MPLGEAIVYLKRSLKRRLDFPVNVKIHYYGESEKQRDPNPVILINGEIVTHGFFSLKKIIQKLEELNSKPS